MIELKIELAENGYIVNEKEADRYIKYVYERDTTCSEHILTAIQSMFENETDCDAVGVTITKIRRK